MREKGMQGNAGARYLSPLVKQDLARLDKDGESRRSAMNSLKHFVENLDPSSMPRFLAQVSETRDQGVSRSYAISLYEEVARVHGKLIIPHIPRVMATVIRSLSSSGSSPQLHQACAKVVCAVAIYSIDGASPVQAIEILRELCNPLLDVLAGKLEPLAAGAAVCLKALVDCDKWQNASEELINETCLKVTVALGEKITRTVAHLELARHLATTHPLFFNNYGVALLRTCSEVLRQTSASGTWQQRASAARLLQAVLPTVDRATLASELGHTAQALDDCKHDRMAHVRLAVGEALKTAKGLSSASQLTCDDGSSYVMFKSRGEKTYSTLENSVITVYRSQEGMDLLMEEEVSSNCTTVEVDLGRSSENQGSIPIKQSSHNQVGSCTDCVDLISSRSSRQPAILNGPTTESVFENKVADVESTDESICLQNVDYSCSTPGVSRSCDFEETIGTFSDRQLRYHSLPDLQNVESVSISEKSKSLITAEDFLPFSTPRRLVRSLQTSSSSPPGTASVRDQDVCLEDRVGDMFDMDLEICSDTGWSVRDNPIASEDSFKPESKDEDKEQLGKICKTMTVNSGSRDCTTEVETGNLYASDCQKLSVALLHVAESLFCSSTDRALEPECDKEHLEVVKNRSDYEEAVLGIAPAHSQEGLTSSVRESCLSDCVYSWMGSTDEQSSEVGDAEEEIDNILACNESTVRVRCMWFYHFLRDNLSKRWGSLQAYTEFLLGGFLLVVLALPFAMVLSKVLQSHVDHPGLIPT